ncbi:Vesicle-associated protein 1-3 [Porphyridium purpureum]|uniref:Vesicle-associated protein 1-3 n=1 Tax=Porphyridium purpureum TaxID=35688 RepID=A0A5J4Z987_PORPP|nr:Vesicle-associated protein 1-3 [Porphyridium purpureum]|eukprot:POR9890..scf295_1
MDAYLAVNPSEFNFVVGASALAVVKLSLMNVHASAPVVFKLKTTNPTRYYTSPTAGVVAPGQEVVVDLALEVEPGEDLSDRAKTKNDKFLLQVVPVEPGEEPALGADPAAFFKDMSPEKEAKMAVQKFKCTVVVQEPTAPQVGTAARLEAAVDAVSSLAVATPISSLSTAASPQTGTAATQNNKVGPSGSRQTADAVSKAGKSSSGLAGLKARLAQEEKELQHLQTRLFAEQKRDEVGALHRVSFNGIPIGSNTRWHETLSGIPLVHVIVMCAVAFLSMGLFLRRSDDF